MYVKPRSASDSSRVTMHMSFITQSGNSEKVRAKPLSPLSAPWCFLLPSRLLSSGSGFLTQDCGGGGGGGGGCCGRCDVSIGGNISGDGG